MTTTMFALCEGLIIGGVLGYALGYWSMYRYAIKKLRELRGGVR